MKILNALPPYNLFGLEESTYEGARIVVVPIPYDYTSTYMPGSRGGPNAIIGASRNLELYSIDTGRDISKVGIYTTEEVAPDLSSPENMVNRIRDEVSALIDDGKVPLLIGGEHTIAVGSIKAFAEHGADFAVLHFDAHSDSRDELYGSRYCHATVMARVRELCKECYSVGIRSVEEGGMRNDGRTIYMRDIHEHGLKNILEKLDERLPKRIYLTFDFDVLDPSEMPSTGTPEPDGLHFSEVMEILRTLLPKRELIGMDFDELLPIPGLAAPDFLAAKLIYNTLGHATFGTD